MRGWKALLLVCLTAACASAPKDSSLVGLEEALQADLFRGGSVDLNADLAGGEPVALVFWQAWCGSCVAEAPAVQKAYQDYKGRIKILGVVSGPDSAVDESKLLQRILELGLTYDQIRDRDTQLADLFHITGTPTIIILDRAGKVVYDEHRVPASWDAYL